MSQYFKECLDQSKKQQTKKVLQNVEWPEMELTIKELLR